MTSAIPETSSRRPWVLAFLFLSIGLATAAGGIALALLGGSPYYALAGVGVSLTGILLWIGRRLALWFYALVLLGSTLWALAEVGLDFWQLLPRLDVWFGLGLLLLLTFARRQRWSVSGALPLAGALAVALVVGLASLPKTPGDIDGALERGLAEVQPQQRQALPPTPEGDWTNYGGTAFAQHYTALDQITPDNVGQLQVAWRYHTGDLPGVEDPHEITNQVTPLKVGDTLYLCTPHSIAIALDATSGQEKWRFDPKIQSASGSFRDWAHMTCRGVSYYDANAYVSLDASATTPRATAASSCPRRIFLPTADARLIALNAEDGSVCTDFGDQGTIHLLTENLDGRMLPGGYFSTSPPAVTRDLVVIGSHVSDNYSIHEASGVVRAFDVHDGHLVWNWDSGNPDETEPLPEGRLYSHNSANMWSVISVDETLGMMYLPMGNQTPDQWGANRSEGAEKYSSGVVALDVGSGQVRWHAQFTHHDLWDRDVSGQPTLVDIRTANGVKPALISAGKQGHVFVLDRRDGTPIFPVREVSVPQDALPGDRAALTQPVSDISFEPPALTEAAMWGTTPFDQLYCRIRFRQMRYDGPFTPPGLTETLVHPGNAGAFDWGGVSIDPVRQLMLLNPNSFAFVYKMIPAEQVASRERGASEGSGVQPNTGAPYGIEITPFVTPWGLPCQAPPWGWVAAVDLTNGETVWKKKNGTTRDNAPLGIPLPLGVPGQGGMLTTAGGVTFFGAALDNYLRAYDVTSGRQLFKARLPAGGQATPMSYQGKDGRQYVVIMAGGHGSLGTKMGDSLIAYALPSGHSKQSE
ncbi:membrane-bound PQQ-dependent dehydrogenase, glucose/quinate/shikimate family [Pseudomonas oryzihabitans]|uniref:membrane-bound PQQ-dependent dehydrogenase, glucose/quinate/shikimate family n=1 Tax=Pseudomonas oryzihabitans TaxID=47885 RepID=UPI0028955644|nr:membrane-bound PQQ-dependent dehydrogenase, glucose/quinate/shikimate family [Pseudomonas oryzihabitans]MDT3720678.1 membrane-bound PQQ-dependent dehydrogenase, glucose/quinate/shikimate family [Pseudomonas oryzihabitans]